MSINSKVFLVSFDSKLAFNRVRHIFPLTQTRKINFDDNSLMFLFNFLTNQFINVDGSCPTLRSYGIGQEIDFAGVLLLIGCKCFPIL